MQYSSIGPQSRTSERYTGQAADNGRANKGGLDTGITQSGGRSQSSVEAQTSPRARDAAGDRQSALKIVEQTLAMGYEKLAAQQKSAAGEFARFEPLSADTVAGNILGFIELRLQKDAANGATQEELEQRLEQGLAGFEKGFAQAREQLEALSMLTPDISADVDRTQELVLDGIDQLRQRLLEGQVEAPTAGESDESSEVRPLSAYAYEQARATSFNFELTTAEGDRVAIQAQSASGYSRTGDERGETLSLSSRQSLSWEVQGELSDSERAAISDLVGDVDQLAGQFFAGDLDAAMASAQSLGYDQEEIVGFSLNLRHADIQRVSESYGQVGNAGSNGQSSAPGVGSEGLQERLAPLGDFARDMAQARANARELGPEPDTLLLNLAERLAAGDENSNPQAGQSLREFMEQMLVGLDTVNSKM